MLPKSFAKRADNGIRPYGVSVRSAVAVAFADHETHGTNPVGAIHESPFLQRPQEFAALDKIRRKWYNKY